MAEDALEVVQVAPLIAAVGVHPDKVAAARNIQATDGPALQRDTDDRATKGEARLDLSRQLTMISLQPVPNPQRYPLDVFVLKNKLVGQRDVSKGKGAC